MSQIYSQDHTGLKENRRFLFYGFYSALIILLCYGFSPLIRFYSTDSAVFYSIGKAMDQGMTAYRDVFDHKGPWIYAFNWAGAFLDRYIPGFGMYVVEVLFCFTNMVIADRILSLFTVSSKTKIVTVFLFIAISLNYFTYMGGNFTETYALTFQLIGCFLVLKYYTSGNTEHPISYMFMHGFCSGVCLLLRANLAAMWVPFGIALAARLLRSKKVKNFFANLTALFLGVLAAAIPPLLYCVLHHCVADMIFCAFTFNFSYLKEGGTFGSFLRNLLLDGQSLVLYLSFAGCYLTLKSNSVSDDFKRLFVFSFLFVFAATFMGMRAYGHYFQTLLPFTLPVFVRLEDVLMCWERKHGLSSVRRTAIILGCVLVTLVGNLRLAIKYLPIDTTYKHLYTILDKTEHQMNEGDTLLSTQNIMQAYVITDMIPNIRYPYIPDVDYETYPEPIDEMYQAIVSGDYDFIFGSGYEEDTWEIFECNDDYQEQANRFIRENYRVLFTDELNHYVVFEHK